MTDKATGVRMVSLRTHKRPDGSIARKGDEFEATELEAKRYSDRENPLAGPLEDSDPEAAPARRPAPAKRAAPAKRGRPAKGRK